MSFSENRKADLDQLKYLVRHKRDVYEVGRELGAPRLQLLVHDWDKFKPNKWVSYRDYWFGPQGVYTLGSREAVPEDITTRFRSAADKHLSKRNHHEYKRKENPTPLTELPLNTRREILADWYSVSRRTSKDPDNFPKPLDWIKKQNLGHILKEATYLAHATNKHNIEPILDSGKLKRFIDHEEGNEVISVEPYKGLTWRSKLKATAKHKNPKHIFFTQNGYDDRYGEYVILKKYNNYKKHDGFTLIPNEVKVSKPVSLKRDAMIFVPEDEVTRLSKKYPDHYIRPITALPISKFTLRDRINKVMEKTSAKKDVLADAHLFGSRALGIQLPNKSDNDYNITVGSYEEAIDRSIELLKHYPDFKASMFNEPEKRNILVYKGSIDGVPTDIVFNWSEEQKDLDKVFERANEKLTDERRKEIIDTKVKLKNSFWFPETRYRNYKYKVNKELGVYF